MRPDGRPAGVTSCATSCPSFACGRSPLWFLQLALCKITYGELALRFCGTVGHAVYQCYCDIVARVCGVTEEERERERERVDMRQTRPNFTCNFAVVGDPQRENAEVFNYIYPVEPVGRILTGNHSSRSYEPLLSTLCVPSGSLSA